MHRLYTFLGGLLLCAFGACSPPRFMYSPSAVNVPDFTRAGQGQTTAAISPHGLDLQGGYAFTDHWAVQGNVYGRASNWVYKRNEMTSEGLEAQKVRYRRFLAGIALTYFGQLDQQQRYYWSVSAGYNRGSLHMWQRDRTSHPEEGTSFTSYHYRARSQRLMAQAAVMRTWPRSRLLLSFRETAMIQTHQRSDFAPGDIQLESGRSYYFAEPALTYIYLPKGVPWMGIRLQYGGAIRPTDLRFDILPQIANIGLTFYPGKSRQ